MCSRGTGSLQHSLYSSLPSPAFQLSSASLCSLHPSIPPSPLSSQGCRYRRCLIQRSQNTPLRPFSFWIFHTFGFCFRSTQRSFNSCFITLLAEDQLLAQQSVLVVYVLAECTVHPRPRRYCVAQRQDKTAATRSRPRAASALTDEPPDFRSDGADCDKLGRPWFQTSVAPIKRSNGNQKAWPAAEVCGVCVRFHQGQNIHDDQSD